nr:MAG TPA: hypothetical protein [Caudoviricetes sp.]
MVCRPFASTDRPLPRPFFNAFQLFLRTFCPIYANMPLYISDLNT